MATYQIYFLHAEAKYSDISFDETLIKMRNFTFLDKVLAVASHFTRTGGRCSKR